MKVFFGQRISLIWLIDMQIRLPLQITLDGGLLYSLNDLKI